MMQIELDDLREEHIQALLGTAENFRIEFKGELDLTTPAQRLEAAKDISALANSAGGRIFYGICEHKDKAGPIAERVAPLTDPNLQSRLENVVADTIHPRPHWRARPVSVEGGFVLVAEVYPSLGRDLHMVSHDRFYRRGETRTTKMTEPEVREAYFRISTSSHALEEVIDTTARKQRSLAPDCCQSVMILPWYSRRDLVDPRTFKDIGTDLVDGPFKQYCASHSPDHWGALRNIRGYANGLHAQIGESNSLSFHFFITRAGVVHLADNRVFERGAPNSYIQSVGLLDNLLVTLRAARLILDRCYYWGPVHVIQTITAPETAGILLESNKLYHSRLDAGRHEQAVSEVNLAERGDHVESVARDILDQLFQTLGGISCPLFQEDGSIREEVRRWARL
jgi:hypothetical protein